MARQRCCGFVEQKQSRLTADASGNFDLLAGWKIQVRRTCTGVDVGQAEACEFGANEVFTPPTPDGSGKCEGLLHEQEVLRYGQISDERDLLEGGSDA